jgi:iron complex outermembrane receptor protein
MNRSGVCRWRHFSALVGRACALTIGVLAGVQASAEPATFRAEPVVVIGTRVEERRFDVPAAVDAVDGERLRDGQLRVNLSETLVRVPGLLVQNRQNYAQDLQVSSRGFGARATFGVRGVRLVQDGIPITMPDGQGQTALFDLDGARSVEVLRGPFAALYGNSSGGVVHLLTRNGPARPTAEASVSAGSFESWRAATRFGGSSGGFDYTGNIARFETAGYREHSAARRDTANVKLRWSLTESSSLTLIGNALDQPDTQDPLGLTQAQLDADPRQAGTNVALFNTRKSIDHRQAGLVFRHRVSAGDALELMGYTGQRRVVQYLAIPLAAQGPTSSGGVVNLDRDFGGGSFEWRRQTLLDGRPFSITFGLSHDTMTERRRGFVNDNGVPRELRRDEDDRVHSTDQYVISSWQVSDALKLSGGIRHSDVRFRVDDHYVVGPNPDDSGTARYSSTMPVVGALLRLDPDTSVFASIGKGFETPTFVELAYRPDGQPGPNFDLRASKSVNSEIGIRRWLANEMELSATAFRTSTRNDIVSAGSSGGRNTFTNAGRTRRTGLELALDADTGRSWSGYAAYTYTQAAFAEGTAADGLDLAGRSMPGVPRHMLYAEGSWRHPASGFSTALEFRATSKLYANDANSAAAGAYEVVNWRGGLRRNWGAWRVDAFVRVDNLLDEKYVGSVIVNEANQRYFEPAPTRNFHVGMSASRAF